MTIPQATTELADLIDFITQIKADYDAGKFTNWQDFSSLLHKWYTPKRLQAIDSTVMGWEKMASYHNQQTLIHVTAALVGLLGLPEYQALSDDDKNLVLWIVLYHDVSKVIQPNKRDHTHGFKSAATCGAGIMGAEWVDPVEPLHLYAWHGTTTNARIYDPEQEDYIQDNTKLPRIMDGIDRLFDGRDSPAGLIICGVLFHMSLTVTTAWPQSAPLSDDEIKQYISPRLFPLLRAMMITDGIAWSLFEPDRQKKESTEVRQTFANVKNLITIKPEPS